MDSLTLRLTPSWHRGFDRLIAHPAARATTCVIGISHDELLAVHEKSTSFLTHLKPLTEKRVHPLGVSFNESERDIQCCRG